MRPRTPLEDRLLASIKQTPEWLEEMQDAFPIAVGQELQITCIDGPKQMRVDGPPIPTVHALYGLIFGMPFHRSWRTSRICLNTDCVHPFHHELRYQQRRDGTPVVEIPTLAPVTKLYSMPIPDEPDMGLEDYVDLILLCPTEPDEVLAERFDTTVDTIHAARKLIM